MSKIIATIALFVLVGCGANMFTSSTNVSVLVSPDGTCQATYSSNKEETGLEASVCGGKVKVDKAGTLESVVAATAASQAAFQSSMGKLMEQLSVLIPAAAKAGALAGS